MDKFDVTVKVTWQTDKARGLVFADVAAFLASKGIEPVSVIAVSNEPVSQPDEWVAINE